MTRPSEDSLIARFFAPIAGEGGLGLKDDAACLTPKPGHDLVLTADALVEGVHFLPDDPPGSIARKALGVNVSDLAAKGADPAGFLLSLALARGLDRGLARRFRGRPRRGVPGFRLPAPRRRHREGEGAADPLGHRARRGAGRPHGPPHHGAGRRPDLRHRHHRRCGAWA